MSEDLVRVRVVITRDLIDRGVRGDPYGCPLALGLDGLLVEGCRATVFIEEWSIEDESTVTVYNDLLGARAWDFVEAFDRATGPAPQDFPFDIPRRFLREEPADPR